MIRVAVFLILIGGVTLWYGKKSLNLLMQRYGLRIVVAGFALIVLARLGVDLLPDPIA